MTINMSYCKLDNQCILASPQPGAKTPGGVLLGIFGGGVPPASLNPDPISDQKMSFPTPVCRLDLACEAYMHQC